MASKQLHDITEFSKFTSHVDSLSSNILILLGVLIVTLTIYQISLGQKRSNQTPPELDHLTQAIQMLVTKESEWRELPLNLCAQKLSLLIRESLDKELGSTILYRTRHELNQDPTGILKIDDRALADKCQEHLLNLWSMKYQAIQPNSQFAGQAIAETKTLLEDIKHYCS